MTNSMKPILVTGSHRSGSTWAGKILAAAPHVMYIQEPFNIRMRAGVNPEPFKYWFQYICEENSKHYENVLEGIMKYKYPLIRNIIRARSFKHAIIALREQSIISRHRVNNDRPLVKDPIAFFSSEWLYHRFNMDILVIIRHPAAFCSSLKIKNWTFDFNHFLNQPLLMDKYLSKFQNEIYEYSKNERDIIDQAILLWNCIYYTVNTYQENYPEWLFVRHEDLSLDPVNQFRLIYEKFDLDFTDEAESRILVTSGTHNPIEQQKGNAFLRNSKQNINNWKNRLSSDEIELIKMKTSQVSSLFYAEDDWQ